MNRNRIVYTTDTATARARAKKPANVRAMHRVAMASGKTDSLTHRATEHNGRTICTCGDFNCASLDAALTAEQRLLCAIFATVGVR